MSTRPLKRIDLLRHELKALRFILDNYHGGKLAAAAIPPRDDFQSPQCREIYDRIMKTGTRGDAEAAIGALELDEVDIKSFLRLTGEHYYSYPQLVRQRAEAIRQGRLRVEAV